MRCRTFRPWQNLCRAMRRATGSVSVRPGTHPPRIDMLHVPYRGDAPALTDLIGGQVQVFRRPTRIDGAFQVRQLTCTGGNDCDTLRNTPDVATVGDFVLGYEASSWHGVGAPKGTPAEIA